MRSDSKSPLVSAPPLAAAGDAGGWPAAAQACAWATTMPTPCSSYTIDGYVGLTAEQEQLVKERTGTLMAWHRSTQLRDYAQLVETSRRRLETPVTAADVLAFNQAVNARLAALGERAAPDLAQLALTLTPDQIARLQRKLASDNSKARRELVQFAGKESAGRARQQVRRPRGILVRQPDPRATGTCPCIARAAARQCRVVDGRARAAPARAASPSCSGSRSSARARRWRPSGCAPTSRSCRAPAMPNDAPGIGSSALSMPS